MLYPHHAKSILLQSFFYQMYSTKTSFSLTLSFKYVNDDN